MLLHRPATTTNGTFKTSTPVYFKALGSLRCIKVQHFPLRQYGGLRQLAKTSSMGEVFQRAPAAAIRAGITSASSHAAPSVSPVNPPIFRKHQNENTKVSATVPAAAINPTLPSVQ